MRFFPKSKRRFAGSLTPSTAIEVQQLGSLPEDHMSAARHDLRKASDAVIEARDDLNRGVCLRAGQQIDGAYYALGSATAHRDSDRTTRDQTRDQFHVIIDDLAALDEEFEARCVLPKPKKLKKSKR